MTATVVDDGDGTYSLKISGTATDVGGNVNNIWLNLNMLMMLVLQKYRSILNNQINEQTGAFETTISLDSYISGTFFLKGMK